MNQKTPIDLLTGPMRRHMPTMPDAFRKDAYNGTMIKAMLARGLAEPTEDTHKRWKGRRIERVPIYRLTELGLQARQELLDDADATVRAKLSVQPFIAIPVAVLRKATSLSDGELFTAQAWKGREHETAVAMLNEAIEKAERQHANLTSAPSEDDKSLCPVLQCAKCETRFAGKPGKTYPSGVLCPVCKQNGKLLVGVCHPTGEFVPEEQPPTLEAP